MSIWVIAILIVAAIGKRSYDNYRERASAEVRSEDGSGDNAASISERTGAASNEVSSAESVQAESAYADSGSQECITVSRQYVAMLRRYNAGTLPAFDVADMVRLQNFRGVLFGCKGGESKEEKEYLAQHPKANTQQPPTPAIESTDQATTSATSNASYPLPPTNEAGNFAVDVGIFNSNKMAHEMIMRLAHFNLPAFVVPAKLDGRDVNRVLIGRFEDRSTAESARQHAMEAAGINAELIELDTKRAQSERNRSDEEERQLDEEEPQLQAQRNAMEQNNESSAQRREMCENYRTVMEGQIRQGRATPANLEEGLRQRGCANDGQSQSAGSATPTADGYVQIEFIGRDPPSPFTFRAASDDTNRVNGASAGIRFSGVNLPCGMYRLFVDKPQDAGGGVARDTDLCKASGFMILPGEIYTLRNRSNSDLVSKNVRGQ